jgi:hypothetical protein
MIEQLNGGLVDFDELPDSRLTAEFFDNRQVRAT